MAGLDLLAEARRVEIPPRGLVADFEDSHFESEEGSSYAIVPLVETDDDGSLKPKGSTLWLHHTARWYWDFFSYSSDSWAWVTDKKTGGKLVVVDKLSAYLTHQQCYGDQSITRTKVSSAHAFVRNWGIAVCKSSICANACAEQTRYGRWCTKRWCG